MIEKLESLAADLIPWRKWMLVAFLVGFIGAMPVAVVLMILFKTPVIFFAGMFLSFVGFTWPAGLFLISFWYNPNGGPLTLEKIKSTHSFFKWPAYLMQCFAPVFLAVWFLTPFIVLVFQVIFMKTMMTGN